MSLPIAPESKRVSSMPMKVLKVLTAAATTAHALKKETAGDSGVKREMCVKMEAKLLGARAKKRKVQSESEESDDASDGDSGDDRKQTKRGGQSGSGGGGHANSRVARAAKRNVVAPASTGVGDSDNNSSAPATSALPTVAASTSVTSTVVASTSVASTSVASTTMASTSVPSRSKKIRVKVERVEEDKSSASTPSDLLTSSSSSDSAPVDSDVARSTTPADDGTPRVKKEGGRRAPGGSKRKPSTHGVKKAQENRPNFINKLCEHVQQYQELYSSSSLSLSCSSPAHHLDHISCCNPSVCRPNPGI